MVLANLEKKASGLCVLSVAKKSKGSCLPMGEKWRSTGIGSWRSSLDYLPNLRSGLNLPVLIYGITMIHLPRLVLARSRNLRPAPAWRRSAESRQNGGVSKHVYKPSYQLVCGGPRGPRAPPIAVFRGFLLSRRCTSDI